MQNIFQILLGTGLGLFIANRIERLIPFKTSKSKLDYGAWEDFCIDFMKLANACHINVEEVINSQGAALHANTHNALVEIAWTMTNRDKDKDWEELVKEGVKFAELYSIGNLFDLTYQEGWNPYFTEAEKG